ncbi:MAG: hypothetical protein AAFX40_06410 [Cyanobacteria bacterium J06639_1]
MSFSDSDRNPDSRNPDSRSSDRRNPDNRESESRRDPDRAYDRRPDPVKSAAPPPTPRSDRPSRPRPSSSRPASKSSTSSGRSSSERASAPRSTALDSLRSRGYEDSDYGDEYGRGDRQTRERSTGRRPGTYERSTGSYSGSYSGSGGYGGGGGYGSGYSSNPERESSRPSWLKFSNLSILVIVALVMFFSGFAMRDVYTAEGGFDDERPIQAEQVPSELRNFCIQYNGYPSFSLLTVDTVSALTASTVPILKLDTCTIPTRETANALAALGVERRSESIGLQLGGSNLTLVVVPLADKLALQLYGAYPGLASDLRGSTRDENIAALQERIVELLVDDINNITLQNVIKTNLPGVFAVAPGHSFPIQPQVLPQ